MISMIQNFSCDDPTNDKLQEEMARIRGKLKQVCSMLAVHPDFKMNNDGAGLSF
uniref:Uncharacterized protein n=1 Tax=Leptobrachium leishanense TaxID=445787 RepID=A0A8C5PWL2_9ANUR